MKNNKTSKVVLGGICLALTLVFLYLACIIPGIELTMLAIASLFTAIMIIESGAASGLLLYVATCILGFVILPNKLMLIPYALVFGTYGEIKYLIEKKVHSGVFQIIIKTALFAVLISYGVLGFKKLIFGAIELPNYPAAILIAGGTLFLLLYDFLYTQLINFYVRKIQRKGLDDFKLS